MKRILLLLCLLNQAAQAADLQSLGDDLGKVYRSSIETEARTPKQEELRKQISASLANHFIKVTFLPLNEIREQLLAMKLEIIDGAQGYPEVLVKASENLPTIQECKRLQILYSNFEISLADTEKKLTDVFYSTSPYLIELTNFQDLKAPLQTYFSVSIDMAEGLRSLDSMLTELASLGFRWNRKMSQGRLTYQFDQQFFQQHHQVASPELLKEKQKVLSQLLQGPIRRLNYLKSVQVYISTRFGTAEFELALRELANKLK